MFVPSKGYLLSFLIVKEFFVCKNWEAFVVERFCTEHAQKVDVENHYVSYFHIKKDYNNFEVINSASLRSLVLKAAWDWLPHGQNNYLIAMSSTSRIPCLRKNRFVWVSSISCLSCLLCCSQCVAPVRQRFYFSSAERLPA